MKILQGIGVVLVFFAAASPLARSSSADGQAGARETFRAAETSYNQGNYAEAIGHYESIVEAGLESGELCYNLGNAYLKNGNLGRALLNYERARQFLPRDMDVAFNRNYALAQVKGEAGGTQGFVAQIIEGHLNFYTIDEMMILITIILALAAAWHLLALYFKWSAPLKRGGIVVLGILFAIYWAGLILKVQETRDRAVAVEETSAYFEPRENATIHFKLFEGSTVKVLRCEDAWIKIKRPDGRQGWAPRDKILKI